MWYLISFTFGETLPLILPECKRGEISTCSKGKWQAHFLQHQPPVADHHQSVHWGHWGSPLMSSTAFPATPNTETVAETNLEQSPYYIRRHNVSALSRSRVSPLMSANLLLPDTAPIAPLAALLECDNAWMRYCSTAWMRYCLNATLLECAMLLVFYTFVMVSW